MNAITTCVDYHDYLELTLPWNAAHFETVLVVSTEEDTKTAAVVEKVKNATLWTTNAFYRNESDFNKAMAIEDGLDILKREGWIASVDADVMIPKNVKLSCMLPGRLHLARRRFCTEPPPQSDWTKYPISDELLNLGGYFAIFHAQDPVFAQRPWFPTEYRHAGIGEYFNAKWDDIRYFDWSVLHLGKPRENWFGRATKFLDGTSVGGPAVRWRRQRMARLDADRLACGDVKEKV